MWCRKTCHQKMWCPQTCHQKCDVHKHVIKKRELIITGQLLTIYCCTTLWQCTTPVVHDTIVTCSGRHPSSTAHHGKTLFEWLTNADRCGGWRRIWMWDLEGWCRCPVAFAWHKGHLQHHTTHYSKQVCLFPGICHVYLWWVHGLLAASRDTLS